MTVAEILRLCQAVAVKNTFALDRERWAGSRMGAVARSGFPHWSVADADLRLPPRRVAGAGPWGLSPRGWTAAGAGPWGLSPRLLLGALAGELVAAILVFASGSVSPVLVRSLQFFLRF